jgi:hypothetical protein
MPRDRGNEVLQGHAAKAAGVGFEPTVPREGHSSFQDCPVRPLRHPAVRDSVPGRHRSSLAADSSLARPFAAIAEVALNSAEAPQEGWPALARGPYALSQPKMDETPELAKWLVVRVASRS